MIGDAVTAEAAWLGKWHISSLRLWVMFYSPVGTDSRLVVEPFVFTLSANSDDSSGQLLNRCPTLFSCLRVHHAAKIISPRSPWLLHTINRHKQRYVSVIAWLVNVGEWRQWGTYYCANQPSHMPTSKKRRRDGAERATKNKREMPKFLSWHRSKNFMVPHRTKCMRENRRGKKLKNPSWFWAQRNSGLTAILQRCSAQQSFENHLKIFGLACHGSWQLSRYIRSWG